MRGVPIGESSVRRTVIAFVHSINACHFLLDTGKMRGMSVQDCTRKEMVIPA